MKKLLLILSLWVLSFTLYAQAHHETDADGCPITDGQVDPIPGLPAICYEKLKNTPGPGFPGSPNPIELDEVTITPQNPNHPFHPQNPWYPYITVPVYYPPAASAPANPCDLMQRLAAKASFNALREALASKAGTDNFESGGIFYGENLIGIRGGENLHSIGFNLYDKVNGIMHNHVNGGYSIFSYADIIAISDLYTQNLMMQPKGFFFGVTTNQGTNYMLTIADISKFASFAQKTMDNVGPGLPYEWVYENFVNKDNSVQQNLQGLLNFLSIENAGIELLEYDPNSGKWIPKQYANDNGQPTIISNPCN